MAYWGLCRLLPLSSFASHHFLPVVLRIYNINYEYAFKIIVHDPF